MSLSGVCQPADTDATGTVHAALPVGNTDEPNIPVTRGQNLTHPKRTTSPPNPQQPLKGVKSVSSFPLFCFTSWDFTSFWFAYLFCSFLIFILVFSPCFHLVLCFSPFFLILSILVSSTSFLFSYLIRSFLILPLLISVDLSSPVIVSLLFSSTLQYMCLICSLLHIDLPYIGIIV